MNGFIATAKKIIKYKESTEYFWELRKKIKKCKSSQTAWGGVKYYILLLQYRKLMKLFNADIPVDTYIEGVPTFPHGLSGIFISVEAKLGSKCTIFQQVTIGSNTLKDSKNCGAPTIGNNVYIGVGAKIIGNVRIGNNVRIGSNCVVVEDIPDNATVVLGKPIVIIHDKPRDNTFIPIGVCTRSSKMS